MFTKVLSLKVECDALIQYMLSWIYFTLTQTHTNTHQCCWIRFILGYICVCVCVCVNEADQNILFWCAKSAYMHYLRECQYNAFFYTAALTWIHHYNIYTRTDHKQYFLVHSVSLFCSSLFNFP